MAGTEPAGVVPEPPTHVRSTPGAAHDAHWTVVNSFVAGPLIPELLEYLSGSGLQREFPQLQVGDAGASNMEREFPPLEAMLKLQPI